MFRPTLFSLLLAAMVAAGLPLSSLADQNGAGYADKPAEPDRTDTEVTAGDNVYKWTDADGVTHYGKEPPPEVQDAEQVDLGDQTLSTVETTEVQGEEKEPREQLGQPPAAKATE